MDVVPVIVPSNIARVTVFSDRAQVFRQATAELKAAGEHVLQFDGAWARIQPNSLQVNCGAGGDAVILNSVQIKTIEQRVDVRPEKEKLHVEQEALTKEEQDLTDAKQTFEMAISSYKAVMRRVAAKPTDSVHDKLHDVAAWEAMLQMVMNGIRDYTQKLHQNSVALAALAKKRQLVSQKLAVFSGGDTRVTQRTIVEVSLTAATAVTLGLQLSYVSTGASWKAIYDLRLNTTEKSMAVGYNALVQQTTHESWKDVSLELSTAKPHLQDPPALVPWRLQIYVPAPVFNRDLEENCMMQQQFIPAATQMFNMMPAQPPPPARASLSRSRPVMAPPPIQAASVSENQTSATYGISGLTTVRNDNDAVKVTVMQQTLSGHFRYSAVPRLDSHAYLKVKAKNTTAYHLVKGKVNVFADNQFVATSSMDAVAPQEEFWTFVGIDDTVKVERTTIHKRKIDISGLLSKRRRMEHHYVFTVKNNRPTNEEVVVWDQLPIADDKKLTVAMDDVDPERQAEVKVNDTQCVEWFLNLRPHEERKFDFKFHIDYPFEETLIL